MDLALWRTVLECQYKAACKFSNLIPNLNLNLYSLKQPHRIFQSKKARRATQVINRMVNGQQKKIEGWCKCHNLNHGKQGKWQNFWKKKISLVERGSESFPEVKGTETSPMM